VSRVYLDHNATSPLRAEARDAMMGVLEAFPGNPGSVHAEGHRARMTVETARQEIARLLGAHCDEILLTAGGTESNNLALFGVAAAGEGGRIVTSGFEHPSVLIVMDDLAHRGFDVVRVRPSRSGVVSAAEVLDAAAPGTVLVSIMLANNEVGTLQPVAEIGRGLRERGVTFHCDAAQAAGKITVDVADLSVDLLSIAGHKFGGPQGVGALYVRRGTKVRPHLRGGGQELNRRPGTENVAGIAGLGVAARVARESLPADGARQAALRDRLERLVGEAAVGACVNGAGEARVPNTSSISFEGVTGEGLVMALDLEGFGVSAGATCSAGTIRKSEVLEAMGLHEEARSSIRISLGHTTTLDEIEAMAAVLPAVLSRMRESAALVTEAGIR
jgi:cysteine desulfurase